MRRDRRPVPPNSPRLRINRHIRISPLRIIGVDGEQVGVVSRDDALQMALEAGVDLVEISPTAVPPVCKLMDYGRYKYELKKKAQKAKSKQHTIQVKEVRLRPKTDTHDIQVKTRKARGFLEEGDKVCFTVIFRGREVTHPQIPLAILQGIVEDLADVCKVERPPNIEGRRMTMIVTPIKKH
ncbi:MAG: translation initiation factor IF-3 [Planctomycetes bacterium]|nr:translation initiation factor IF-3 [Planctomycetota bacterium]